MRTHIKKVIICFVLIFAVFSVFNSLSYGENIKKDATGELIQMRDNAKKSLEEYTESYGSESYGFAAYILNLIRIYSIPFCFVGIALGAIYQYVIGIRKLDVRDRGFIAVISFVTILVIAQVLPLIFAIVVKGWRG